MFVKVLYVILLLFYIFVDYFAYKLLKYHREMSRF